MKTAIFTLLTVLALQASAQWQATVPAMPDTLGLQALDAVNADVVWAVAQRYIATDSSYYFPTAPRVRYLRSTNGGSSWQHGLLPITGDIPLVTSMTALDSLRAWVAGIDLMTGQNQFLSSSNGGASWTQQVVNAFDQEGAFVNGIYFWNAQEGIALGDPSRAANDTTFHFEVVRTNNGGASWTRIPRAQIPQHLPFEYGINNQFHVLGDRVWFATVQGRVFRSYDRGLNWQVSDAQAPGVPVGVHFADSVTGVLGVFDYMNNRIVIKLTRDGGRTFSDITPADDQYMISAATIVTNTRVIVLVLRNSNLRGPFKTLVSHDLGANWVEIGNTEHACWPVFLDAQTGFAGEWQPMDHKMRMYRYTGSPLTGLFSGHELQGLNLQVGPNPARDQARVSLQTADAADWVLLLHDSEGRLIQQHSCTQRREWSLRLDLQGLPAGAYSLTLSNAQGHLSRRLVKM